MQTISFKAKVMVLPEFRHCHPDNDSYWTGTVASYYCDTRDYLVAFPNFAKGWYTAEQLRVIES